MRLLSLCSLLSLALISCGGAESGAAPDRPDRPAASGNTTPAESASESGGSSSKTSVAWDASKGTAHVTGTMKFAGDKPKRRKVDMGSDSTCMAMNTDGMLDESLIVSDAGQLENVFVHVAKGLGAWKFSAPSEAAVLTQEGCTYKPHVLAIQVGQSLKIRNGDKVTHNVHSFSKRNPSFNKGQGQGSSDIDVTFKRGEVLIPVKCDMHGWMSSFIGATSSPFMAVSAADGSFDLGMLPPGTYTIEAVHEVLGKQKAEITVGDGESKTVEFTFSE